MDVTLWRHHKFLKRMPSCSYRTSQNSLLTQNRLARFVSSLVTSQRASFYTTLSGWFYVSCHMTLNLRPPSGVCLQASMLPGSSGMDECLFIFWSYQHLEQRVYLPHSRDSCREMWKNKWEGNNDGWKRKEIQACIKSVHRSQEVEFMRFFPSLWILESSKLYVTAVLRCLF